MKLFPSRSIFLPVFAALASVLLVYTWFITAGRWTRWRETSDYYDQLARAFHKGQLSLEVQPDPALLALPNPYDPKARKGVPFVNDASLYKGRYYLYWGPVPALVLAALKSVAPIGVRDQSFVFLFAGGTFLCAAFLLIHLWQRFFSMLPTWQLALGILLVGLASPFTRMLAHPFIHEAAIAGGQFFLMGGLLFSVSALAPPSFSAKKLIVAGLLWACAIGTRLMLAFPIMTMLGTMLLFLMLTARREGRWWRGLGPAIALLSPILLGAAGLAWYNGARFDSVLEFGMRYQLASFNPVTSYHDLFSRAYVLQNLYNYLLNPFRISAQFPFIEPLDGSEALLPTGVRRIYIAEGKLSGLLYSAPFLLVAIPLVAGELRRMLFPRSRASEPAPALGWMALSLLGGFAASFLPMMAFFFATARYTADFVVLLLVLAVLGFWQLSLLERARPLRRRLLSLLGGGLGLYSVLMTTALAFAARLSWFGLLPQH